MKYLLVIGSLFAIISGILVFTLFSSGDEGAQEVALKINDRIVSREELETRFKHRTSHHLFDADEFLQSLVSKELFIQEAQKLKIDHEDAFRYSIQNFYEQSLIRVLMDRKMETLEVKIDEQMVDRYLYLLNKRVTYTVWELDSINVSEKDLDPTQLGEGSTKEVNFRNLGMEMRSALAGLQENEYSKPIAITMMASNRRFIVLQLKEVNTPENARTVRTKKEKVKQQLIDNARQLALNHWIESLKTSSDIQIMVKTDDPIFAQSSN